MGRSGRLVGVAMVAIGITLGSLVDYVPRRLPARSGGEWILAADLHVHAFPGDGSLTPYDLRDEAMRVGLDAIAVTNHNQMVAARLANRLPAADDLPLVIPGEEVTHRDYHLIALGVHEPVPSDLSVVEAVERIHAQGGVAIAAHPSRRFSGYSDAALAVVDGTEVAHPERLEQFRREYIETFERARTLNPRVAPIGSSDFHNNPALGQCRTFLFVRERSVNGVLEAIRSGRTVATDERGRLFGDASLIERVRQARIVGRSDPNPTWRRLAVLLVWTGTAAIVLL